MIDGEVNPFLNVYQVGSELGMSTNTVLRYIKDYYPYIPYSKDGRSYRFTTESFPVIRFIQKHLIKKKTHEQIMVLLEKKFSAAFPEEMVPPGLKDRVTPRPRKKKQSANLPLLERVATLEGRLQEVENLLLTMQKSLTALREKPSAVQQELNRLKRLIEG